MAVDAVSLKKELDNLATNLTERFLDMHRSILADNETKYNHLRSQLELLLGKADSGNINEKKAPKRIVASSESNIVTTNTAEFPNMEGFSEKTINMIKSLGERGVRPTYLSVRCMVDETYYSTISELFRNEHENSPKSAKAKKTGQDTLRGYVAARWWDENKDDKVFKENLQKEMKDWISLMLTSTPANASQAMDNE